MTKKLISVRFDVVNKASTRDADITIARYDLPQVPDNGEVINIEGNPYIVYSKGWSIDQNGDSYCYVRLMPFGKV